MGLITNPRGDMFGSRIKDIRYSIQACNGKKGNSNSLNSKGMGQMDLINYKYPYRYSESIHPVEFNEFYLIYFLCSLINATFSH